jgi:Zn-dependent protease with chaperone function
VSFALWTAGACLATFAVAAGLTSFAAWVAGHGARAARSGDAARTARRLLALRVLPATVGAALALVVTLPAFLRFEPRESGETVGLIFSLLAIAGGFAIGQGLARGMAAWWASRRLHRSWTREGRPLELAGAPVPACRITHPFPVVSIVGILRPRLFVADQVLEHLSPAELRAVLAHEAGHVRAADNLKRLLVRLCPALPWRAAARRLEERWEEAAEEAADARAGAALDLAAALLKTARLAPVGARIEMPVATFHEGSALARRVKRLTRRAETGPEASIPGPARGAAWVIVAAAAAAAVALWPQVLSLAHRMVEALVHLP